MSNPFTRKPVGFSFSDITDLATDTVTGMTHYGLEQARAGAAFLSGDFERAGDKFVSAMDTAYQGAKTAYSVAGDVYDWASDAKSVLAPNSDAAIAQQSSLSFQDAMEINRKAQQKKDNAFLLIAAGIAAKFLLF